MISLNSSFLWKPGKFWCPEFSRHGGISHIIHLMGLTITFLGESNGWRWRIVHVKRSTCYVDPILMIIVGDRNRAGKKLNEASNEG